MSVDWANQWEMFAENFYDGKAHIDLSRFGGRSSLLLLPGPGFGDLSHPTTHLMLQLMQGHVAGRSLIDIGCGSGILSLAALMLGASSALGIDIDPEALIHARENAQLNQLDAAFVEKVPDAHPKGNILLMNMILPEQKIVMQEKDRLNALGDLWITSGILISQREAYCKLALDWGWKKIRELHRGEWAAMIFTMQNPAA